jgi:hypothetical protein
MLSCHCTQQACQGGTFEIQVSFHSYLVEPKESFCLCLIVLAGNGVHARTNQAILNSTIPVPVLLSHIRPAVLTCTVSVSTGAIFTTSSLTGRSGTSASAPAHLRAQVSTVRDMPLSTGSTTSSTLGGTDAYPAARGGHAHSIVLTQVVRGGSDVADAGQLPRSCGWVVMHRGLHDRGHVIHPAVADSTLHLGSTLPAQAVQAGGITESDGGDVATETRVPVAFGAYMAAEEIKGVRDRLQQASACIESVVAGSLPESSYRFGSGVSSGGCFQLQGLQVGLCGQDSPSFLLLLNGV